MGTMPLHDGGSDGASGTTSSFVLIDVQACALNIKGRRCSLFNGV